MDGIIPLKLNLVNPIKTLMAESTNLLGSYSFNETDHSTIKPVFNSTIDLLRFQPGKLVNSTNIGSSNSDTDALCWDKEWTHFYRSGPLCIQNYRAFTEYKARETLTAVTIIVRVLANF